MGKGVEVSAWGDTSGASSFSTHPANTATIATIAIKPAMILRFIFIPSFLYSSQKLAYIDFCPAVVIVATAIARALSLAIALIWLLTTILPCTISGVERLVLAR